MEKKKGMGWFDAAGIILLIFAILGCLNMLRCLLVMVLLSFIPSGELGSMETAMNSTNFMTLLLCAGFTAIFFTSWYGIKNRKKLAVYMMYLLHAYLPLSCIAGIWLVKPIINASVMTVAAQEGVDALIVGDIMNLGVSIVMIVLAIITACALIPNTIYFKNRLDMLN